MKLYLFSIIGLALAVGSFAGSQYPPIATGSLRPVFSLILPMFFFLGGVLASLHTEFRQQGDFLRGEIQKIDEAQEKLKAAVIACAPVLDVISSSRTAEANFEVLNICHQAKGRTVLNVVNTRIFPGKRGERGPALLKSYEKGVTAVVRRGGHWRDVISSNFTAPELKFQKNLAHYPGGYFIHPLDDEMSELPVMNFVILEYSDASKEAWFGWPIEQTDAENSPTLRTRDARIVQMFESWHRALCAFADRRAAEVREGERVGSGIEHES